MPTLPYVENGAQVAVVVTQSGQDCLHTFHVLGPAGWDNAAADNFCEFVYERWGVRMMPGMSFKAVAARVEMRGIRGEGDAFGTYLPEDPVGGAITNEGERPQEAACIKTTTGRTGAGFRGRMFLAGLPNNVVNEGLLDDVYRNGRASALQAFFLDLRGGSVFNPVVVSYYREKEIRPVPVATPITGAASVRKIPSKLESRAPGSGT